MPVLPHTKKISTRRTGGFQRKGQGVCADLRLSLRHIAVHQCGLGEAFHLSQFPHPEVARAGGARSLEGVLEAIDMDSYRVEKQAAIQIQLTDADAEIA